MVKKSGPQGVTRPFTPTPAAQESSERIAEALESIAVSLAAIDHNLEALVNRTPKQPTR